MKLEPVAWYDPFATDCVAVDGYSMFTASGRRFSSFTTPLYVIPDGYVVVPVDKLLAEMVGAKRPDDPLESIGGSTWDKAFNFGVDVAISRCQAMIAAKAES